jgi:hypothetical protein
MWRESSNRQPSLADPRRLAGRSIGTRKTSKNRLVTSKTHLAVKDGDSFCRGGGRMKRELAKVLLDEIVRTRAQLVRLQIVLARRTEEKISRMDQCEECERFGKRTRQRRLSRFSSTRSSGR